jgi:hypothetical protein
MVQAYLMRDVSIALMRRRGSANLKIMIWISSGSLSIRVLGGGGGPIGVGSGPAPSGVWKLEELFIVEVGAEAEVGLLD